MKKINKIFKSKTRRGIFKSEKRIVTALENVDLIVNKGEIFSLLGPNGAGKTTAIKILTTLLLPNSGKAIVNGYDIHTESQKVRASINAMLMGERSIYWKLTGRQNLEYFGTLYYQSKKDIEQRIEELTRLLKLDEFLDHPVEGFSSGQKYKVAFAKALINSPPLIFLDEPTATLDPRSAKEMRSVIKDTNKIGTTIFLTTHNMIEASELSNRTAIIDLGKIITVGSPEMLSQKLYETQQDSATITLNRISENLVSNIKNIKGIIDAVVLEQPAGNLPKVQVITSEEDDLSEILMEINREGLKILNLKTETPTLEDVFLELTGRSITEDTQQKGGN